MTPASVGIGHGKPPWAGPEDPFGPPSKPENVNVTQDSSTSTDVTFTATWDDLASESSYDLSWGYDNGNYTDNTTLPEDSTSHQFTIPRASQDEGCFFCVKGVNSDGAGEPQCVGFTVPAEAPTEPPAAASNLQVSGGDQQADLTWTDNSTTESGFKIHRSETSGFTPDSGNRITTVGENTTSYTDTDNALENGHTYYYVVVATNEAGDASPSNEDGATLQSDTTTDPAVAWDPSNYADQTEFENDDNPWEFNQDGCDSGPCMELVNEGVPALGTSKSIKYNHGDGAKRFGLTLNHPKVWESWYEVWVKFDADFKTEWGGDLNADFKFMFALIEGQNNISNNGRWSWRTGLHGCYYDIELPGGADFARSACSDSSKEWDGEWHRYRMHCKSETSDGADDGVFEVWIENESGGRNQHLKVTGDTRRTDAGQIKGLAMGRNINQMPDFIVPIWFGHAKVWTEDPGW